MAKTVSDLLVDRLIGWGVDTIFGFPGDGVNGIFEALRTHKDKLKFIQVRHEEAAAFAERLISEMSASFALTAHVSVNVGASIGVALIPDHGTDVLTALNAADKALNVAKAMGKSRWSLAS